MRFATIRHNGSTVAAVLDGDTVHPFPAGTTVLELVRAGLPAALAAGEQAVATAQPVPVADAVFDAPLRPPTIRDFVTFEEHVEGVRASVQDAAGVPDAWYAAPHFYFTNPYSVTGPDARIIPPAESAALDFELEVAVVVGKAGTDLTVEEAAGHIFGYTVLNDWSARDLQKREMQVGLGPAKGKDFANTLGPVLVTADEFADFHDEDGFLTLACTAQVNGVEVGADVLSNMAWSFPALLAYASRNTRIEPGDILGSGTVGNGGCLAEQWGRRGRQDPPPLHPGDIVTLLVEGIGTLTNTIGTPAAPAPILPAPRRRDHAAERARHLAAVDRA
ncbi:fumarylacetoacetate hydrolase family protein [Rhodococcus sp. IEGM 1305]|uniref:fumarylacetoacetate hydrolase family protein n=1 Tax=Rhodococcus sp. IEGM 1305 TaxID=3047092 RepID=UPI0024B66529|nr:fumarylacetoacetate hydrolase family protein [Rhodococcus sp. IEGM 1305]MDI9953615.1 fumarylacetoacetate hydrolase family protein [Rhodococcus sp. IEGM 1305]